MEPENRTGLATRSEMYLHLGETENAFNDAQYILTLDGKDFRGMSQYS